MNSHNEKKQRIVVADDHPEIIELVIKILGSEFEVAGSARNGLEAIGAIAQFQPDVLITDVHMPIMDGISAARHLRRVKCGVKVIFMSGSADPEIASVAMSTDASAFVLKTRMATDLSHAIREALAGRQFVSETVDAKLPVYSEASPSPAIAETVTA